MVNGEWVNGRISLCDAANRESGSRFLARGMERSDISRGASIRNAIDVHIDPRAYRLRHQGSPPIAQQAMARSTLRLHGRNSQRHEVPSRGDRGGVEDHVHILVGIPATACVSDIVRDLKRASNSWIHEIIGVADFQWQVGYAALSANANGRDGLYRYINGQEEHHRHQSSLDELRDLLDQAGVTIDERYFD